MFHTKVNYFRKVWRLWDVENHGRDGKATNDDTAHAFWMLDT